MHVRLPVRLDSLWLLLACALALAIATPRASLAQPAALETPFPADTTEPPWRLLVDRARLLDEGQRTSAINDAARLNAVGIPAQVVVEPTGLDPAGATERADDLRRASGIETAAGADDGMLIYASVTPSGPESVSVAISVGVNTLPAGGLTRGDLDTIRETIVVPQLEAGRPARAIVYPMREMLYQYTFTPPPTEPVDGRWQDIRQGFQVSAAIVVVVTGALLWLSRDRSRSWWAVAGASVVAGTLFVLSVLTRSGLGIASSLLLAGAAVAVAVHTDRTSRNRRSPRLLRATPRPPGSIQALTK